MVRGFVVAVLLSYGLPFMAAQSPGVKVKIRAALYDRDLNLKPVPHLGVSLRSLDREKAAPVTLQTSFDGMAEAELPAGRYALTTSAPIEFQGKSYVWEIEVNLTKGETVVELSNDNAKATDLSGGRGAKIDELADYFKRLKASIVTVWTQDGHGTGFLVDPPGLVVTNQHVIAGFTYLAVQFDNHRKLEATLLADDKQQDVAVLRVNMAPLADAVIAPIAETGSSSLLEGERVFTIGNPLDQEKVLTTGIVSKVDRNSIMSDININPGNSGGPLFNSNGKVVGITSYGKGRRVGPGLSGIVPIADAADALAQARQKMAATPPPSTRLLPVSPATKYPTDGLRSLGSKPWEKDSYYFKLGDFDVEIITPVTAFQARQERATKAEKEREKRAKKSGAAPAEEPQATEYESQYDPVISFYVSPRLKEAFWKSFGEGMASNGMAPITMRFKSDFLKMRLLCGEKEVEPILPGRYPVSVQGQTAAVRVNDATYAGDYTYLPDAISPACKQVSFEIYSVKEPDKPLVKMLEAKAVQRISDDFEPFRKAQLASTEAPPK